MMPSGLIALPLDMAIKLCEENNVKYNVIQCPDEHKRDSGIPVVERVLSVTDNGGAYTILTAFFSELDIQNQ
ncbi:MAG: hypothetical protein E7315_03315 [Clostridiales bacterium]|nr:hypothetical protein [Clostridiales bacterium]